MDVFVGVDGPSDVDTGGIRVGVMDCRLYLK